MCISSYIFFLLRVRVRVIIVLSKASHILLVNFVYKGVGLTL